MAFSFEQIRHILTTHISKGRRERQEWDRYHAWYLSEDLYLDPVFTTSQGPLATAGADQESELKLETNYPYAFIDTMVANVCPTNPLLTVTARERERAESAKARESLINDSFRRDKMHFKASDMATYASMCGRAFSKTVWSAKHGRPLTRVINPRNMFYDMSVDWDDVRYVIEAVAMTKQEFDEKVADDRLGYNKEVAESATASGMPTWLVDRDTLSSFLNEGSRMVFEWVIVYEFYDFTAGRMYLLLENGNAPLFEGELPFKFVQNPYSMFTFNKNLIDNSGVSDIKLIARQQERLNEIDTLELWFAHSSIPVMVLNEALVDNIEVALQTIRQATGPGDVMQLNIKHNAPLNAALDYTRAPTMSPSFDKMRDRITGVIEFILGLPQYARGQVGGSDIATEVALADTATRTRNGRRIKVIETWIVDAGLKILSLWREFFPKAGSVVMRGRLPGEAVEVNRASIAFPNPIDPNDPDAFNMNQDEWFYDYEAVPFSPTENNRLVQLQKLAQFLEFLAANPNVDQSALVYKMTELLGIEEVRKPPGEVQQQQPGMPVPGQPQPGQPQPPQPGPVSYTHLTLPTNSRV